MNRSYEDEIDFRAKLRQRYFEDPNYRRWSDIFPLDSYAYGNCWDDVLFSYYVTGRASSLHNSLEEVTTQLNKGLELPVDWSAFYDYFDAIIADGEYSFNSDLEAPQFIGNRSEMMSIKGVLDVYRDRLTNAPYDMV